ncbi:MAG TPA: FISUMP domain-containing protein, partial [bacterium]|nr:FISUMP domain-containing protein [bacterium]
MKKSQNIIKKKNIKKYFGFTFIELLVVIAIIGLLATLSLVATSSVRVRVRDSNRVANVNQIMSALEGYYASSHSYPTFVSSTFPISDQTKVYLNSVPSNPQPATDGECGNEGFVYSKFNTGYKLTFCLGADSGRLKKGYNVCINGNCKPASCENSMVVDRDGNAYPTILIGGQCWMAESLKTKTTPSGVCINTAGAPPCPSASSSDYKKGRSCYEDQEGNCDRYGALYTWDAAMNGSTTEGAQGICPDGWHVPTFREQFWFIYYYSNPQNFSNCVWMVQPYGRFDCSPAGTALRDSSGF